MPPGLVVGLLLHEALLRLGSLALLLGHRLGSLLTDQTVNAPANQWFAGAFAETVRMRGKFFTA